MKGKLIDKIKSQTRRFAMWILIILSVLLFTSLVRNILRIRNAREIIAEKEKQVEKLKKENEEAKKRLEEVTSEEYIEKQLRDGLGLAKEGETVVVLPDPDFIRSLVPDIDSEEEELPDPNWKKWLKLFN